MAKLILRGEDGADREVSLDETGSVTIGRSPECDIPIQDTQASRRHCTVVRLQKGYEMADLGSTNGTLVNSTLTKKRKLQHGDVIRIGAVEIVFSDPDSVGGGGGETQTCSLVYAKGDRKGEKVELTQQRTTIGRKPTNSVVLTDAVSSSYHCEIVRDLNGYTIRDLGSTNGTLVNNEMITEAQLTHGARIRIGNTRFVFQDPAMAEIDLELAGVEDEDEWGMMRDLDLAAVKKRNPATIVYSLLFVAIIGAGVYFTMFHKGKGPEAGPQAPAGNLHDPYSFESQADAFAWDAEPAGAVSIQVSTKAKKQGASSLELKCNVEKAEAFYSGVLDGAGARFTLDAQVSARGTTARIGLLWTGGLDLREWSLSDPINSGGFTGVKLTASAPPWASRLRLGLQIDGQGTVYLDDVALRRVGPAAVSAVELNEFKLLVRDGSRADMTHANAPILAKGRPVALDASGAPLTAECGVSAEKVDDEHVRVTITGPADAAMLGLRFESVAGFLRGGYRAFGYEDGGQTYFKAGFVSEGTRRLEGVRKLLVGPSTKAFATLPENDDGRLVSVDRLDENNRRIWTVLGPAKEGSFSFRYKFDLRGEAAVASESMSRALDLHQSDRWGEFLEEAGRALAEFPFADATMRDRLQDLIGSVTDEYTELAKYADRMLADYKEFKDLQSLDNVRKTLAVLRGKFQIEPGKGPWGERLAAVAAEEAKLRAAALKKRQGEQARSRVELAEFVFLPDDEYYSAGVLLAYVAWYLPDSEQAAKAQELLAEIDKKAPKLLKVLRNLNLENE
jgi:pSer/pThr/pTyr-binding forkhead associated (FHA) protein